MPARPPVVPAGDRVERKRGRAGQKQRQRRLERTNGLCERCLASGRYRPAHVVNHKLALAHGGSDDDGNTENLCRECDAAVTAEQFGHVLREHRGIGPSGRPTDPGHAWNLARRSASSRER